MPLTDIFKKSGRYGAIQPPAPTMDPTQQWQQPVLQQPTAPLPTPGATGSQFGPDQNLIGTQLNAQPGADTTGARQFVGSQLGALGSAPDRGQLAGQTYSQLAELGQPQYEADLRNVGEKAAALGRVGAGMTTSELGDVASNREKYLGNLRAQLATQSAGQTLDDRLRTLGAGQSVLGQLGGLDQQQYLNTVGERGYQHGLSQEAFQNSMQQNALLASLGGFNPNAAGDLGQMGASNLAGGSNLAQLLFQNYGVRPQQDPNNYGSYGGGF